MRLEKIRNDIDIFEWVRENKNPFSKSRRLYRKCIYGSFGSICGLLEVERTPSNELYRSFWFSYNSMNFRVFDIQNMNEVKEFLEKVLDKFNK